MRIFLDTSYCRQPELKGLPSTVNLFEKADISELFEALGASYCLFVFVRDGTVLSLYDELEGGDVIRIIEN